MLFINPNSFLMLFPVRCATTTTSDVDVISGVHDIAAKPALYFTLLYTQLC